MHYSFRNTLCGLAVVIAAGLLAEQSVAQTVTLEADESDMVSLAPVVSTATMKVSLTRLLTLSMAIELPAAGVMMKLPARSCHSV